MIGLPVWATRILGVSGMHRCARTLAGKPKAIAGVVALVFVNTAQSQFEIGVSGGGFLSLAGPPASPTSYIETLYYAPESLFPTLSLAYNERKATQGADITISLDHFYKEYRMVYSSGGHVDRQGGDLQMRLHMLYLTAAPDIHLLSSGRLILRPGVQCGFLLAGSARGDKWSAGVDENNVYYSVHEQVDGPAGPMSADWRAMLGLRYEMNIGDRSAVLLDAFTNMSFSTMFGNGYGGTRGLNVGLRVGYAWRCKGRPLTSLIGDVAPKE